MPLNLNQETQGVNTNGNGIPAVGLFGIAGHGNSHHHGHCQPDHTATHMATLHNIADCRKEVGDLGKELQKVGYDVSGHDFRNTQSIKDQLVMMERKIDEDFCQVRAEIKDSRQEILNRLFSDKLDEKNDEIAELRAERAHLTSTIQFSNQFTAINSAIADLSQAQRLTNQTIQFRTGNLAGQAATSNQVR